MKAPNIATVLQVREKKAPDSYPLFHPFFIGRMELTMMDGSSFCLLLRIYPHGSIFLFPGMLPPPMAPKPHIRIAADHSFEVAHIIQGQCSLAQLAAVPGSQLHGSMVIAPPGFLNIGEYHRHAARAGPFLRTAYKSGGFPKKIKPVSRFQVAG